MTTETDLQALITSVNIAEQIDEDTLKNMGSSVYDWYEMDENSRAEWMDKYEDYMKLATQVSSNKNFPWPDAANVKYPLLTISALQFAARAYQSLIPNNKVVKTRVIGNDPDGSKAARARRVSNYMSYQLLEEMDTWEDEMDRTCLILPIIGNVFKKTYWDGTKMVSTLVLPKDLCVDYYASSLEDANRKTHKLYYYPNEVTRQIRMGHFLDVDLPEISNTYEGDHSEAEDELLGIMPPSNDEASPHEFLECHCNWDLDEDGYEEPYVITVHKDTKQVVRVAARYDQTGIDTNEKGEIISIEPVEYFTNYVFINDPNSGVYGMGFGNLLGPLNEAANTLINQLIDSGTLDNLQSGFLAKGIKIPNGNTPLKPGEWRYVNTIGDDLRKGIVPLPTKQPSTVLFQLLSMMISSGQQLSSVTDLMTGENPGQNQPWSTTSEVLKQGLQVFSSIYKRIHRSMKREFKKIYRLNMLYLEDEKYFAVLDPTGPEDQTATIGKADFEDEAMDIVPNSDPTNISNAEKLAKAESLMQLLQLGSVNPQVATKRILEAQDQENIAELMQMPEPKPDFDQQIKMQEMQIAQAEQEITKVKVQYQAARDEANATLTMAKAQSEVERVELEKLKLQFDAEVEQIKLELESRGKDMDVQLQELKIVQEQIKAQAQANKEQESTPS
jgi:chaperonin GroES